MPRGTRILNENIKELPLNGGQNLNLLETTAQTIF